MYYLDLVDCLPRDFESILLGSEETVAQVGAGILSLTMPIKAYDLVNTADMVLRQLERRIKKKTRTPKKRSEKEQNYIRNAKISVDGEKLSDRGGSSQISAEMQYG